MGFFDSIKQMIGGWASSDTSDDAFDYLQSVLESSQEMAHQMGYMNEAMDEKDYEQAETVRKEWITLIDDEIERLDEEGFEGDKTLYNAMIAYLNGHKKLMQTGYKTLISLRAEGKRGTPEEQKQLTENNAELQRLANEFDAVSEKFQEKYNLN